MPKTNKEVYCHGHKIYCWLSPGMAGETYWVCPHGDWSCVKSWEKFTLAVTESVDDPKAT